MARKLKKFLILLDEESLLYFPGSFLTGKVLLEIEEDTPVTGKTSFQSFLFQSCFYYHKIIVLNKLYN